MEKSNFQQVRDFVVEKIEKLRKGEAVDPKVTNAKIEAYASILNKMDHVEIESPSIEDTISKSMEGLAKELQEIEDKTLNLVKEGYSSFHKGAEKIVSDIFKATKP